MNCEAIRSHIKRHYLSFWSISTESDQL